MRDGAFGGVTLRGSASESAWGRCADGIWWWTSRVVWTLDEPMAWALVMCFVAL